MIETKPPLADLPVFDRNFWDGSFSFTRIGTGSLGGKAGGLAFIGLSQVRESAVFSGIPITERLTAEERTCGVCVIDLRSGQVVALLRFETAVQEVFAVTVLPATDLFLMGREHAHSVPRGVAPAHRLCDHGVICSLATNNVLNPFTPFGDCSLIRIANLYANVAQLGEGRALCSCFDMVTRGPASLMNLSQYGVEVGNPADLVVLDCSEEAAAVAEIVQPLVAYKRGRRSFSRAQPLLHRPNYG